MVDPLALLVAMGELKAFFPPDPFHLLVIDPPSFHTQQSCDLAITIAAILFGQANECQPEAVVIFGWDWLIVLRGPCNIQGLARSSLRGTDALAGIDDSAA